MFANQHTRRTDVGRIHSTQSTKPNRLIWSAIVILVGVALAVGFFYFDRHGHISRMIQQTGAWGIVISIVLMTILCVIPVPSEFLIALDMRVFGAVWGALYCWGGSIFGSLLVFLMARHLTPGLLRRFISESQMEKVEKWMLHRGVWGLILVRIIPLPFIVVNYTAGIIRSITFGNFAWTTAVGGIPYFTGAVLLYLGVSRKYLMWIIIGGIAIFIIWFLGYLHNRRERKYARITLDE